MHRIILLLTALLLLTPDPLIAQNTNTFSSKLLIEQEGLIVLGYRTIIEFNTNKFAAVFPPRFRVQQDRQQHRITANSQDGSCVLSLSLTNTLILAADQEFEHATVRGRLMKQFPKAKVLNESWQFALEHQTPTFDLLRNTSAGEDHQVRISFIPTEKALITVSMTSTQERFEVNAFAFADLLASMLQADPDGKLEVNPLSNKL